MPKKDAPLEDDPLWYRNAIIYEVHVRAFADSNDDGVGDFQGLTEKLDYLQDLGVTAIWLLPFCPSPWRDDGYDISDYTAVHPAYGTLRDFQTFLKAAHSRGLRVITELVLNHTSDQHAWFQGARRAPAGSRRRDYYVWSEAAEKYKEARIIFKDNEPSNWSWDPLARAYFWHRFFSHQPDLNFDNPRVRRAMFDVVDFWLKMGVDGLRLDAVPYLYEREGTSCENLPETHAYLKELRRHVDSKFKNRMLLAEANQWPEDAVDYFGAGDEAHMCFQFPVMPRLFMAIRMEDRFPVIDILQQTPPIPDSCQWALFLRNHDELTLEMVTDEERDYMYRVYATEPNMRINLGIRRRLAPLLGNDRRKIELMNGLLFSLPGTPVIYYGDEIGMGDNFYLGDRNGVRTPMQWSGDRNAGFSHANPQRLYLPAIIDPEYHYEAVNVESQARNPNSLLWWMKHLIALRKQTQAFGRGSIEFLHPDNRKVLAFIRRHEDTRLLVIANLSRFVQCAELDLSEFKGMTPVELFGRSGFPKIGDLPYFITLGPHAFFWFSIEAPRVVVEYVSERPKDTRVPVLTADSWDDVFGGAARRTLGEILPGYLKNRRWFGGKARPIRLVQVVDVLAVPPASSYFVLANVEYNDGDPDLYLIAVTLTRGAELARMDAEAAYSVLARVRGPGGEEGLLIGALFNQEFPRSLLDIIVRKRRLRGEQAEIIGVPASLLRRGWNGIPPDEVTPSVQKAEQSNSSILYGDKFILKLFRRLEPGINPDLEIGYFLSEKAHFPHVPPLAGALEYRPHHGSAMTVGILQKFVPNQGDAWRYTLDELSRFFEQALARGREEIPPIDPPSFELLDRELPELAAELIGTYLESAALLGRRTAELHIALSQRTDDPNFAPEPFTDFYRQSLYHGMTGQLARSFLLLRQRLSYVPETVQPEAKRVLSFEPEIRKRLQAIRDRSIPAMRTRLHGDFHLGQVLYTGKDFVIIDFEGEPARPLSERRIKRSPLRDVAGMLRSFHYASYAALFGAVPGVIVRSEDFAGVEGWARFWNRWVGVAYIREYIRTAGPAVFLPKTHDGLAVLLYTYLLEKAVYEVSYELNNRPDWVRIPLHGILQLMEVRV